MKQQQTIAIPHPRRSAKTVNPEQAIEQALETKTSFGFWVYLMTDCVLFGSLFATYLVLRTNTFGGPGAEDITDLPYVLAETLVLLTSSFTCGLAVLAARNNDKRSVLLWLGMTLALGIMFVTMELNEFHHLVAEGNSWRRSGFLSGFFTLVGTHGLHITVGLVWLLVMARQFLSKGITHHTLRRLTLFGMFWHFLDIVWIFIFSIVYMLGATL